MLEIKLFGAMSVTTPNGTVTASELGGVKPRQILEILAISPGIPVPKHQLADLLWDGCPPRSYVSTLESYLCALRRKLGLERGRVSAIRTTNHGYVLDRAAAKTDLHEFRALLQAAEAADPRSALGLLESAVGPGHRRAARRRAVRPVGQPGAGGRPERAGGRRHPGCAAREQPRRARGGGAHGADGGEPSTCWRRKPGGC